MTSLIERFTTWLSKLSYRQRRNMSVLMVLLFFVLMLALSMIGEEVVSTPCSPNRYPGRCYRTTETLCETVRKQAVAHCKVGLEKLALPPTRLLGPIQQMCETAYLDKMIGSSRSSTPDCEEKHRELEEWRKSNAELL